VIRCFEWIDYHTDSYDQYVFIKDVSFLCVSFGGEVRKRRSYILDRLIEESESWRELSPEETKLIKGLYL
jgi:hypothetical protein